ncbi:MAG: TonB-dependent receptor plug domain-containing protein [Bryobacteraceae bacterium]
MPPARARSWTTGAAYNCLNGRNFQTLAVLAPGVIAPVTGSGGRFAAAGTRGLSHSVMLDGATNMNSNADGTFIDLSIDLIKEFKIQRNTFNAEYGNGAAQINVVSKSGTTLNQASGGTRRQSGRSHDNRYAAAASRLCPFWHGNYAQWLFEFQRRGDAPGA